MGMRKCVQSWWEESSQSDFMTERHIPGRRAGQGGGLQDRPSLQKLGWDLGEELTWELGLCVGGRWRGSATLGAMEDWVTPKENAAPQITGDNISN